MQMMGTRLFCFWMNSVGGEFVDAPVFSDDWFDAKVGKNGDVKQYMVRLLHDEDGLPFVESRVVG